MPRRRILQFLILPRSEKVLVAAAWLWLLLMKGLLLMVSFPRLRRLVARLAEPPKGIGKPGVQPERLGWAVAVASRYAPGATCLSQALATRVLLGRHGYPADVHVGVAREENGGIKAHAWVESMEQVIIGEFAPSRYRRMGRLNGVKT